VEPWPSAVRVIHYWRYEGTVKRAHEKLSTLTNPGIQKMAKSHSGINIKKCRFPKNHNGTMALGMTMNGALFATVLKILSFNIQNLYIWYYHIVYTTTISENLQNFMKKSKVKKFHNGLKFEIVDFFMKIMAPWPLV
jgi:hypothetical protein